jgi:hypothetical protein
MRCESSEIGYFVTAGPIGFQPLVGRDLPSYGDLPREVNGVDVPRAEFAKPARLEWLGILGHGRPSKRFALFSLMYF